MDELSERAAERYDFGSGGVGSHSERVAALNEAKALFAELEQPVDMAWCDLDLGIVSISNESTDLDQTLIYFRRARDGFRKLDHSKGLAMAVAKIANVLAVQGQTAAAIEELETLNGIEITDFVAIASLAGTWADLHLAAGDTEEAIASLEHQLRAQRLSHRHRDLLSSHVRIGQLLVTLGRLDEATAHADAAELVSGFASKAESAKLPTLQAEIAIAAGQPLKAMQHLDDALSKAVRPFEQASLLMMRARMASRNNLSDIAVDSFRLGLEVSMTAELPFLQAQAHDGLALTMQHSSPAEALRHALMALAISDGTANHRLLTLSRRCARVVSIARQNDWLEEHTDAVTRLEHLLSELGTLREEWTVQELLEARKELGDSVGARRASRLACP